MAEGKMKGMSGYSQQYTPPSGSAGAQAKGEYSHNSNPMKVPMKGSAIADKSGGSADKAKVASMEKAQASKENLRGMGC